MCVVWVSLRKCVRRAFVCVCVCEADGQLQRRMIVTVNINRQRASQSPRKKAPNQKRDVSFCPHFAVSQSDGNLAQRNQIFGIKKFPNWQLARPHPRLNIIDACSLPLAPLHSGVVRKHTLAAAIVQQLPVANDAHASTEHHSKAICLLLFPLFPHNSLILQKSFIYNEYVCVCVRESSGYNTRGNANDHG